MGGLPFGALASKLAVQFFKSSIQDARIVLLIMNKAARPFNSSEHCGGGTIVGEKTGLDVLFLVFV